MNTRGNFKTISSCEFCKKDNHQAKDCGFKRHIRWKTIIIFKKGLHVWESALDANHLKKGEKKRKKKKRLLIQKDVKLNIKKRK